MSQSNDKGEADNQRPNSLQAPDSSRAARVYENEAAAETVRKMWQHEDTIANHRITWFTTTQGLLFAALALVIRERKESWGLIIVFVGLGACILTEISLLLGSHAKSNLNNWWNTNKGNYAGPPVVGYYGPPGSKRGYFSPSNLLPALFFIAWLAIVWKLGCAV